MQASLFPTFTHFFQRRWSIHPIPLWYRSWQLSFDRIPGRLVPLSLPPGTVHCLLQLAIAEFLPDGECVLTGAPQSELRTHAFFLGSSGVLNRFGYLAQKKSDGPTLLEVGDLHPPPCIQDVFFPEHRVSQSIGESSYFPLNCHFGCTFPIFTQTQVAIYHNIVG